MTTLFASSIDLAGQKHTFMGDILSLTKARLSMLVIFTSALGLFLAPGEISLSAALITILSTSGLVAGACIINCVMEKDIDAKMERTKNRPLPSGRVTSKTAMTLGLSLITLCLLTLYVVANPLTALLGFIATLTYLFLYTPMKQKTAMALFAGAIPGAIPPLMGWTTVTGSIGALGVALFAILFVWQLPHFLSISIYHAEDYKNAGLKTFPTDIGIGLVVHKIVLYTLLLMIVSFAPYYLGAANINYLSSMFVVGAVFLALAIRAYQFDFHSKELLKWSRQYFYATLVYLPCVFVAMLWFR
ncbi:MAG: heme o synthase [Bacteriovoracaceae bacterium]|nr:heme o synthase [Bacteriovoracaceae bacterium]